MNNRIDTIKQAVLNVQKQSNNVEKELAKLARMVVECETVKTQKQSENFEELNFN
jgi:hypothetical protein